MTQRLARFCFLLAVLALSPLHDATAESAYTLNPGDVLDISVWKEEEMSRKVVVLPDGTISFPLAGHMTVSGFTAAKVQDELVKRIKKYIAEPVVTVSVVEVLGNKIYVIGQVQRPGQFIVSSPIDVLQALSLAGGLTPFGDEDDIKILRGQGAAQSVLNFDYSAVKRGNKLHQNVLLKPGDVVLVSD